MSRSINLENTDVINFNGKEVEFLQLNGEDIWTGAQIESVMILNCSSTYLDDSEFTDVSVGYNLHFNINAISETTITFNDFTTTISAGESQTIKVADAESEQQTGDLIINGRCEFSTIEYSYSVPGGSINYYPFKLNEIKEWSTSLDYVPEDFLIFCGYDGSMDLHIPNNIKKIGYRAFGGYYNGYISPFKNSNIYLPENLEEYYYNSFGTSEPPLNATSDGIMYYLDDCLIDAVKISGPLTGYESYVLPASTRLLPIGEESSGVLVDQATIWGSSSNIVLYLNETNIEKIPRYCFNNFSYLKNIYLPDKITSIGTYAFNSCSSLTDIVLPENVSEIGDNAFTGCSKLTKFVARTPADTELIIGSTIFGSSSKTARSMKVFADNDSIINYDFSSANITATIYPVYMADWIELETPTISISKTILTITPVENATSYKVYLGSDEIFTTTELVVDLDNYATTSNQSIYVQAIGDEGYLPSGKASAILIRKLDSPVISLDGTILTITPVENATSYKVYDGGASAVIKTLLIETTETSVDLAEYQETSTITISVTAVDSSERYASSNSNDVTLPALTTEETT